MRGLGATAVAPGEIHALDVDVFAPCALGAVINDGTLDSWVRSSHDVRVLGAEKAKLEETVSAGPETSGGSQVLTKETIFWLLYKLFPALLLCGVSLKLGKTTNAILK